MCLRFKFCRLRKGKVIMGKTTGFLEYERYVPPKRLPQERIKDWKELKGHYREEELKKQAARCMNCGVPFCQSGILLNGMVAGCPLHNLIPQWNDLIYHGKWEEAYKRLTRTNPFPEFTGRVCPAPCEGSCTEGHVTNPVTISNIEYAIIEKAFENGWVKPEKLPDTGKRIAVVGSGPSGLSAAWNLAVRGHQVTVYEKQEQPGGLLMYGIPNMKLDKNVLKRRIDLMQEIGIRFKCNVKVGEDPKVADLLEDYDAVLLAIGATNARRLNVPGGDAKGVVMAVDYLKANTRNIREKEYTLDSYLDAKDKHVIVIGGGDTGTDCVGTAIRQGAKTVHQFEITSKPAEKRNEDKNPWPEWPKVLKTDYGQEEAIHLFGDDPRIYDISTTEIMKNGDGDVKGIKTVKLNWSFENGRFTSTQVEKSEATWECDLVLIAMGFLGPEKMIMEQMGLGTDKRGNILADTDTYETSRNSLYACGDSRRGQSLVVWAITEGRNAAEAIDRHLAEIK
jgi:glutamate synthase (NADPH/NADH) small chain